jgi:hypothetical protein
MTIDQVNRLLDEFEKMIDVKIEMSREQSNDRNYQKIKKEKYYPLRENLKSMIVEILKVNK